MQQSETNWIEKLELVNRLKDIYLNAIAGNSIDEELFIELKKQILSDDDLKPLLPKQILQFDDTKSFRNFVEREFKTFESAERFINSEFFKLSSFLKKQESATQRKRSSPSPEVSEFDEFPMSESVSSASESEADEFEGETAAPFPNEEYETIEAEPLPDLEFAEQAEQEFPRVEKRKIISGKYSQFSISDNINPVLGVKELSEEMAKLLENLQNRDKGRMVGVFGKWGRGKTFLMNQVWERLKERGENNKFYRVDFHAWKFQDTHASWAYLYEAFAKRYYKSYELTGFKKWYVQNFRLLKLNINRFGLLPIISFLVAILLFVFAYITKSDLLGIKSFINSLLGKSVIGLTALYSIRYLYSIYGKFNTKAKALFKKYFDKVSFKQLLGIQAEIQNELKSLLKVWIKDEENKKVLLVVDNIDRCSEERLIQIIDSLRVMLEDDDISQRVVVLAAVDERVLRGAIKYKYYDLLEKDYAMKNNDDGKLIRLNQLTREYMDKLFLSGIKLGILTSEERREIFKEFSKDKVEKGRQKKTEDDTKDNLDINDELNKIDGITATEEPAVEENNYELNIEQTSTEENNEETIKIEITETDFEISKAEYIELNNLLGNFYDATPRQIRIFYYRYLLARNLLSMNMKKSGVKLIEGTEKQNSIMGELLLKFSEMDNAPDLIKTIKKDILSAKKSEYTIKLEGLEISHKRNIFLEIMNVLEMVVAY